MKEFFYFAGPYFGFVLLFIFIRQLLPCKGSWAKMLVFLSPVLLGNVPKFVLGRYSITAQIIVLVLFVAVWVLSPVLFFPENRWKAFFYIIFFYALQMLSDCISYGIYSPKYGLIPEDYTATQMAVYFLTTWSIYILIGSLCVFLMRAISMRRFHRFYLLFLFFPTSQIILTFCCAFRSINSLWVVGVLMGLGAEIALLGYTISQEKKAALEEELSKARHMMELEQAHYKGVEERQEEMARIRHDFNNQLATIGQLIRQGESSDAQHMIRLLADGISSTRENTYCAIPVINAVLTEKSKACEEAGIKLEVQLDIPKELPVEPLHLCSILGNLLDNAVHGAKTSDALDPTIWLSSKMEGDYLFIKVANPSKKPLDKRTEGHGYGTRILRDLTTRYNGEYWGIFENDCYYATVSILV